MNETTTSPIIMALLFVLRCLIPLGVLFGVSYLLRRLELVNDRSDDLLVEAKEDTPVPPPPLAVIVPEPEILISPKKANPSKKKISSGKKKHSTSKKKKEQNQ